LIAASFSTAIDNQNYKNALKYIFLQIYQEKDHFKKNQKLLTCVLVPKYLSQKK